MTLKVAKLPKPTKHFNQNQKVWLIRSTGAGRYLVTGKFRGKGRYVTAWVDALPMQTVEVSEKFYAKISNHKAFGMV